MKRRDLIGASTVLLSPGRILAQSRYKVGVLASSTIQPGTVEALSGGLARYGLIEGSNFVIELRTLRPPVESDTQTAVDLVGGGVDVIVVWGTAAAIAARRATSTVPIVMVSIGDPIGSGLIGSLAKPGGNVTGLANLGRDVSAKQVELLTELVAGLKRIGVVQNKLNSASVAQSREAQEAMAALGLETHVVEASSSSGYEGALLELSRRQVQAVFFVPDPSTLGSRTVVAEQAILRRLPSMFQRRENVLAGGLMSYGADLTDQFRLAADYVERIRKGARPADMPVQQPTKIDLVINLKTARHLGFTVPQLLLQRADELIE